MRNLDLGPGAYRRIPPLGMSTLQWLNDDGRKSGRPVTVTTSRDGRAPADTKPRIPESALDAAQAVTRYYTERKATRSDL